MNKSFSRRLGALEKQLAVERAREASERLTASWRRLSDYEVAACFSCLDHVFYTDPDTKKLYLDSWPHIEALLPASLRPFWLKWKTVEEVREGEGPRAFEDFCRAVKASRGKHDGDYCEAGGIVVRMPEISKHLYRFTVEHPLPELDKRFYSRV